MIKRNTTASNKIFALGKIFVLVIIIIAACLAVSCKPGQGGAAVILMPVK